MAKLFKREKRDVTVVPQDLWRPASHGMSTPTGLNVTPYSALTVTSFFAAIRFRSFAVASLPKFLYQRTATGKRRATEHPLYSILHDIPNPEMTAFDLWATLDSHVMIRGNAYAEIVLDKNENVVELWPLRPDRMNVTRDEVTGELRYLYTLPDKFNNEKRVLQPYQILHLRGLTHDGVIGYAPITMMRNAVALSKATEEFGSAFFGNGAQPGMVLKHPSKLKDPVVYDRIKDSWEQAHMGLDQAHRVAILEEGMSVEKIGLSPEDSQFLQTRVHQVYEISRMTDVPPQMIFELSQMNYSTMEQMTLDFVVHHLRPWLVAYEQQSNRSLLLDSERKSGYFVENLIDGLLRGDLATRYNAYSIGRSNGWLSINDVRKMENMNAIKGGDKYMVPLNYSVIDDNGIPMPAPSADPIKNPNTPARAIERPAVGLYGSFLRDAADRIGKRELNEYTNARKKSAEKFTAWVEQFYKRDYPEFIFQVIKPFIDSGLLNDADCKRATAIYCERRGAEALNDAGVYVVDEIVKLFEEQADER